MTYLQFMAGKGNAILVEVDQEEVVEPSGVVKVGARQRLQNTIVEAQSGFDAAMEAGRERGL